MLPLQLPTSVRKGRRASQVMGWALPAVWCLALFFLVWCLVPKTWVETNKPYTRSPVLVSYSYFEKDDVQKSNFEFFLALGTLPPPTNKRFHWVFVISGETCTPCKKLLPELKKTEGDAASLGKIGVKEVYESSHITLLYRSENVGMDIAAHNITLEYLAQKGSRRSYKYFIFLNSSIKGPFFPSWTAADWHWSYAYLERFKGNVHAVGSSLVCLPSVDAGGPGPRLESWAFAVDQDGLRVCLNQGVFHIRSCKLCVNGDQGIVVGGEYGITTGMFKEGYNVATLMSKYAKDIDWTNPQHWHCNNNVHPSRHATYDGISFHPYETIFVKSSWHVSDVYTSRYSIWQLEQVVGGSGTEGHFDEAMYRYAISPEAQLPNKLEEAYKVTVKKE